MIISRLQGNREYYQMIFKSTQLCKFRKPIDKLIVFLKAPNYVTRESAEIWTAH